MTTFSNSPRPLNGGIVLIDLDTSAVQRIIALQYNPDTLSQMLQPQAVKEGGDRSEALRLAGPPVETITIEANIDAIDQRHVLQASVTTELTWLLTYGGLAPSLAQGTTLPRMSTGGM